MSTKILFPNDVDHIKDYAKTFLNSAKYMVGPDTMQQLVPNFKDDDKFKDRMLANNILEMPKLLTLDDAPNKEARKLLEDSANKMRKYWRKTLPPIDGEDIKEEIVGITKNDFADCPPFCVLYRRNTNLGSILLLQKHVRIDPGSGVIATEAEDTTPFLIAGAQAPEATAPVSSGVKTVVDAALTLTTFIGFGIAPPAGIVLAGLAATVQVIFDRLMGTQQDSLLSSVDTVVRSEIQEESIIDIAASFNAYADWFKTYYDASWANQLDLPIPSDLKTAANEAFKEFYKSLKESVDNPNNPLLQNIAKAMQSHNDDDQGVTFQVKALQTFLYGAALHLDLLKVRILLDALPKYQLDSPFLPILVSRAKEYADHGKSIVDYIEKKIQDRLNQVSEIRPGAQTSCKSVGPRQGPVCSTTTGLLFTDSGPELPGWEKFGNGTVGSPSDTVAFIPDDHGSCCTAGEQHPDQAQQKRDAYIAQLTTQQKQQYFYTQDDGIKSIIKSFQDAKDTYEQFINKK